MIKYSGLVLILFMVYSCSVVRKSSRTELSDGFYTSKQENKKQKVYVDSQSDYLEVYLAEKIDGETKVDTNSVIGRYGVRSTNKNKDFILLRRNSFDIDFLTVPLKYRRSQGEVQHQLNTELNGSVYFGLRTDKYNIGYELNPLGKLERKIKHFSISFGVLTGLGSSAINPTTTNNSIEQEYDGMIWTKGVASIFAINTFSIGLSFGADNLLDDNRSDWIYESKPWFGIALGLSIN